MRQTLGVIRFNPDLTWAYYTKDVTAELIGEMDTGEKVWQDATGKQYLRCKINHHYYFVAI